MFPYKDDNPQILVPYATYAIIAINIITWFFVQGAGFGESLGHSICKYGVIPEIVTQDFPNIQNCRSNIGTTSVITSMFLHGGWWHLIGNMVFLWVFGGNVEDSMGSLRFSFFYFCSGFFATASQVLSEPTSPIPMIGASGAIGGILGAYLLFYPKVRVHLLVFFIIIFPIRVPAYAMLGYWFVLQTINGLMSDSSVGGTAFWAHAGGFLAGIGLGYMLKDKELLIGHPHYGWQTQAPPETIWNKKENQHKND